MDWTWFYGLRRSATPTRAVMVFFSGTQRGDARADPPRVADIVYANAERLEDVGCLVAFDERSDRVHGAFPVGPVLRGETEAAALARLAPQAPDAAGRWGAYCADLRLREAETLEALRGAAGRILDRLAPRGR